MEHVWQAEGMNGEWRCLTCGRSGGNGTAPFYSGPCLGDKKPVTGEDGTPPKVMAAEEVEKMLNEVLSCQRDAGIRVMISDIRSIASKYGITLKL